MARREAASHRFVFRQYYQYGPADPRFLSLTDEEILLEILTIREYRLMSTDADKDPGKHIAEEAPDALVAELQRFRDVRQEADRARAANAIHAAAARPPGLGKIMISFGEVE